ncbi:MAG: chemotaxis protein CheW [Lachnospiraceae bacterium]|nr:chemotaxis protein CheW [Lachnospiraceae bacterium]MDE6254263.1 chemotaxis protein CheW [Lachnospiraceae bacterium]
MVMEFTPVVFTVGNQEYGVDIGLVRGIEKFQEIVRVPNSNPDIKGIINLRGDIIPIYSLRHHFKMDEIQHTEESKFIVVNTHGLNIALEVENVEEIHRVEDDMLYEIPTIVKSEDTKYIDKVLNVNGRLILVLNIENLLTPEEAENVQKMVNEMQ